MLDWNKPSSNERQNTETKLHQRILTSTRLAKKINFFLNDLQTWIENLTQDKLMILSI